MHKCDMRSGFIFTCRALSVHYNMRARVCVCVCVWKKNESKKQLQGDRKTFPFIFWSAKFFVSGTAATR